MATKCEAWIDRRGPLVGAGGVDTRRCSRRARYVSDSGNYLCAQHAKEPATTMHKATGKIRKDMREINTVTGLPAVGASEALAKMRGEG